MICAYEDCQFKFFLKDDTELYFIETILLYIFFGAFILAIRNRIKR